ncbi:hypothetical protein, partial [Shouchella clausii]|uniref:hypothetical protein n=1 Tax=Shouchella clausii TaxID=79880 RepID=UPI00270DDC85
SHLELEEESSSNSKVSNIHPSLYHQKNAFENYFLKGVLSTIWKALLRAFFCLLKGARSFTKKYRKA